MFRNLWSRLKGFVAKLFRREPHPGRFESESASALRGWLAGAPWILPRREYLVYVPRGHSRWRRAPLVVLLHGCRQTADEVAGATRIAGLADELGCVVLLPRQNPRANPWGCWNWFDNATTRGWGETAIVAAQIRAVRRRYNIHRKKMYVAGLSSGGALAAVLGVLRPELVAGVFVHSGIACGAASSAMTALQVLKEGANTDYTAVGRIAREHALPHALPVPIVVVQGGRDEIVAPVNAAQIVRQYLVLNAHPAADTGSDRELPPPDLRLETLTPEGRTVTTSEWRKDGTLVARHILVDALGHAWSGGDDRYPYNDPLAPDATALLAAFVRERYSKMDALRRRLHGAPATHEEPT